MVLRVFMVSSGRLLRVLSVVGGDMLTAKVVESRVRDFRGLGFRGLGFRF